MRINIRKNLVVFSLILILINTGFLQNITGIETDWSNQTEIDSRDASELHKDIIFTCYTFGLPGEPLKEISLSPQKAEYIHKKILTLQSAIANNPQSDDTIKLQQEIIAFAKEHKLLPHGFSIEKLESRLINSWHILPQNKPVAPLQQNRVSKFFCNYVSTGSGSALPVIIFPRLVPVLLTPIPRLFVKWSVVKGVTSCGGLLTGTGFIASGKQQGLALGFWGIGFSVFLPPLMAYLLLGYALFVTVSAEEIEYWPPNYPPDINAVYPPNGTINIPISTSELSFNISDQNGNLMNYTVTTDPFIGYGSGGNKPDGTYNVSINGLEGSEEYIWHVQVSDGEDIADRFYSFTTEMAAPIVSHPKPENGTRYVPVDLSQLSFNLRDPQGDLMDYTVETSPDIGSSSGYGVGDGMYTIDISGLDNSTEYMWYVNVTDGVNWKHKVFVFQTEPKMVFDPFAEGWQYRKRINIDHTKVDGDLRNFPVLVSVVDSDLRDRAQDDGDDILFMNRTGVATRLYHEIEHFDGSTGELVVWVNVTNIDSDQNTLLYMFYGNSVCDDQQAPERVWDDYYVGVWHLNEEFGNIIDSTGTKDGIVVGSPSYQQSEDVIYKSIYFDGTNNEYFDIVDETYKFNLEDVTLEIWVYYVENRNMDEPPLYFGDNDNVPQLSVQKDRSDSVNGGKLYSNNRLNNGVGETALSSEGDTAHVGHWIYQVGRFEREVETSLWINGQKEPDTDSCSNNDLDASGEFLARIGRAGVGGGSYLPDSAHIYLDEVRVSNNIARNAAWISTSYNNQKYPLNFLSLGPEETGS